MTIEEIDEMNKRDLGARDIGMMIGELSEKFDRRKFGKFSCPFCERKFNPFYLKQFKYEGEWKWVWRWEYKEPERQYECNCPSCNEDLRFRIYIGQ